MTRLGGILAGDVRATADGDDVSGIVHGDVVVAAGVRATVSGIVEGRVLVEPGAQVTVSGMVSGGIENRGGTVRVTGMVGD